MSKIKYITDEDGVKTPTLESLVEELNYQSNRSLSDEYLRNNNKWDREEAGIGDYNYGIIMVPENWVLPYLNELLKLKNVKEK